MTSALLIFVGVVLLLPSSSLASLMISGSATTAVTSFSGRSSPTTDTTTTIESLVGFGLVGVGLILEILSLFTDVGGRATGISAVPAEKGGEKQQ